MSLERVVLDSCAWISPPKDVWFIKIKTINFEGTNFAIITMYVLILYVSIVDIIHLHQRSQIGQWSHHDMIYMVFG